MDDDFLTRKGGNHRNTLVGKPSLKENSGIKERVDHDKNEKKSHGRNNSAVFLRSENLVNQKKSHRSPRERSIGLVSPKFSFANTKEVGDVSRVAEKTPLRLPSSVGQGSKAHSSKRNTDQEWLTAFE